MVGEEVVLGRRTTRIEGTFPDGAGFIVWIDQETGLPMLPEKPRQIGGPAIFMGGGVSWQQGDHYLHAMGDRYLELARKLVPDLTLPDPTADLSAAARVKVEVDPVEARALQEQSDRRDGEVVNRDPHRGLVRGGLRPTLAHISREPSGRASPEEGPGGLGLQAFRCGEQVKGWVCRWNAQHRLHDRGQLHPE